MTLSNLITYLRYVMNPNPDFKTYLNPNPILRYVSYSHTLTAYCSPTPPPSPTHPIQYNQIICSQECLTMPCNCALFRCPQLLMHVKTWTGLVFNPRNVLTQPGLCGRATRAKKWMRFHKKLELATGADLILTYTQVKYSGDVNTEFFEVWISNGKVFK